MDNTYVREFPPRTLDKVERLFDVLDELGEHPMLRGKLALYGGTAINLFMLDIPRLSVDIDLSYVGAIDKDEMLAERPIVENSIEEVARAQGYSITGARGSHAGRTYVLTYRSQWGTDHIKIDCIYMNRSPLLPVEHKASPMRPELSVPIFADGELVGGKVKAFFDRVKIRDLYDIANLRHVLEHQPEEMRDITRTVALFYASLSATFPYGFVERASRFSDRFTELRDQLYPMLRQDISKPTLDELVEEAHIFVADYVLPKSNRENEYLERFALGDFDPGLLFADEPMARAALIHPEAQWKQRNIQRMPFPFT